MKKSGTLLKSILAVILSSLIIMSAFSTVFAAQIIDEEQTLQYLYTFNDAVNAIKKDKPAFKYQKTAGMSREEDVVISSKTASDLSEDARKYLSILVDAFFNPEKGLVNNFIAVLTENDSDYTKKEVYKGMDVTKLLPVRGKSYVSDLTLEDEFELYAEEKTDILNPENDSLKIRFTFPECDLETVKESSLNKIFDLPSGAINPVLIGSSDFDDVNDPLDDVKFEDFRYHNAFVQADFDGNGNLVKYTQNISYTFSFSFYDMLRIFTVYSKVDLMKIGLAIANPILQGTGNPEVTAREVLKNTEIFIQYDVVTELSDFDWTPRLFGDMDNNGKIDSYDARSALRYSVGLEKVKNQEDLIYTDVDFDGTVTSSDARSILRMAVELDEKFSEIPDGETVKIVVITPPSEDEPETPEEPDGGEDTENPDSTDPENPDGGNDSDTPIIDAVTGGVSEFISAIFDIVNGFTGEGVTNEGIASIVQNIKDIIAAGKGELPDETPDGGIIIVPDTTENA